MINKKEDYKDANPRIVSWKQITFSEYSLVLIIIMILVFGFFLNGQNPITDELVNRKPFERAGALVVGFSIFLQSRILARDQELSLKSDIFLRQHDMVTASRYSEFCANQALDGIKSHPGSIPSSAQANFDHKRYSHSNEKLHSRKIIRNIAQALTFLGTIVWGFGDGILEFTT